MKRFSMFSAVLWCFLFLAANSQATTYTFSLGSMSDLDHHYVYEWGKNWNVSNWEYITGASLFFDDIRNWDTNSNDLYVHLLDSAATGIMAYYDNQLGGDNLAGQGILLNHWHNLPATAQDITYDFDLTEISYLSTYVMNDGNFGLGFDPDCHFFNTGITLTIETLPVPEPTTMLLVGSGLFGLAGFRRKFKKA